MHKGCWAKGTAARVAGKVIQARLHSHLASLDPLGQLVALFTSLCTQQLRLLLRLCGELTSLLAGLTAHFVADLAGLRGEPLSLFERFLSLLLELIQRASILSIVCDDAPRASQTRASQQTVDQTSAAYCGDKGPTAVSAGL